ncbi:integrin beta-PS-like isoform X3 [Anthonomus grandis grandis]|nr:integrin beta-PS-like isoform X3 [Anthonomus grandis grandis]
MDLSNSMKPSKNTLSQLGSELANKMREKTKNFTMGFGTFVDKVTLPFVNTFDGALEAPCQGCAPPFSFHNDLPLTNDDNVFTRKVDEAVMSGNLDTPEGGLDAIMQAIACKDEIGWRSNARHLLVMSTDAVSHIAGDGKLGGVIEPNDMKCHLTNNIYTEGLKFDYPSVSQINYMSKKKDIYIIFAIVERPEKKGLFEHYEAMSTMIANSYARKLKKNSHDVVDVISTIYDSITSSVTITSDTDEDVSVMINSTCKDFSRSTCTQIKPGQTIKFSAIIEPQSCTKDGPNKKTITIKPEGLADSLTVELEVLCDCNCDQKEPEPSENCKHGALQCGICQCEPNSYGEFCQCTGNSTSQMDDDPAPCTPAGAVECSGHGKCKCGECHCEPQFSGQFCECDSDSCSKTCLEHGTCDCGVCKCKSGWTGPDCTCPTDQSTCYAPGSKELCSGHGKCECGDCTCEPDEKYQYSGKFCNDCLGCSSCDELKDCVECQVYKSGKLEKLEDCESNCTAFNTSTVPKLPETVPEDFIRCQNQKVPHKPNCLFDFDYVYSDDRKNVIIVAAENMDCFEPQPLYIVIAEVIGSILLIGILTLIIWKIVTTVHDKREYARFLNEKNNTRWNANENPLYKPGTSHFRNPVYNRVSQRISMALAKKKPEQSIE